jgi:hypothetical protein
MKSIKHITERTESNGSRAKNNRSCTDSKQPDAQLPAAVRVVELAVEQAGISDEKEEIEIEAKVRVRFRLPSQNKQFPHKVEGMVEEAGQELKRAFYQKIIEQADLALVIARRKGKEGKGIQRIGTRSYTFKTVFGTVSVKRIRIRHKADKSTEIPSAKTWSTPKQICLTEGLREAICDYATKQSYKNTVLRIEERSGEKKIICKSTVKNVLHQEGERLRAAQSGRARRVYEREREAKRLLGRAEAYIAEEFFEQVWLNKEDLEEDDYDDEEIEGFFQEIEWDPREHKTNLTGPPPPPPATPAEINAPALPAESCITSRLDADMVVVQPDEVVVRSQEPDTIWLRNYGAVVITAERSHYFTAPTSAQLLYQVGSLLATLGLQTEDKRLLVISDGAAWIRRWVESIGVAEEKKQSVLCWWHLKKHCSRLLREGIKNKEDRARIKKELLRYLWRGQVAEARAYLAKLLTTIEDALITIEVNNIKALEALREYLLMREQHIPDYLSRLRKKEWIANTKIEKFNDWAVSARCKKKNGMKWVQKGVSAIAALEAVRRNGELKEWRESRKLPSWEDIIGKAA